MARYQESELNPFNWAFHLGLSNLAVLDIDPRNGGLESWNDLVTRFGSTPPTPRDSIATRGWHEWFVAPGGGILPSKAKIELAPGIDLKYGAGYVLGPPSIHRCGHPYIWDVAPWDVPFAELPQWVIDLAHEVVVRQLPALASPPVSPPEMLRRSTVGLDEHARVIERARAYADRVEGAVSGRRGSATTSNLACKLVLGFGLAIDDALPIMREWNHRCSPPWPEEELVRKLTWATQQTGRIGELRDATRPRSPSALDTELAGIERLSIVHMLGMRELFRTGPEFSSADSLSILADTPSPVGSDGASEAPPVPLVTFAEQVESAAREQRSPEEIEAERLAAAEREQRVAAALRDAHYDHEQFTCSRPSWQFVRDRFTNLPVLLLCRCKCARGGCPGCRALSIHKHTTNVRFRLQEAVAAGLPLFALNCTVEAWPALRRMIGRRRGNYFRIVEVSRGGENAIAPTGQDIYCVITTARRLPGAIPLADVDDGVILARTLLDEYEGDAARIITASRDWRLPRLEERRSRFEHVSACSQSLHDELIDRISLAAESSVSIVICPPIGDLVNFRVFHREAGWDRESFEHLRAMLSDGEDYSRWLWDSWINRQRRDDDDPAEPPPPPTDIVDAVMSS